MNSAHRSPRPVSHPRRDALKLSAGIAASSALSGVVLPACHAAGSDTIKLALVGCGGRGTGAVADAFAATGGPVKLVAMADLFDEKLQKSLDALAAKFPGQVDVPPDRRFIGFDAFKKAIDCLGANDVVLLTTQAAFRATHFDYAVQQGVNVFMEKSFAPDAPAVRRLLKAAALSEQKNLKVAAGFMWRHSKAREEVIQRIHNGEIGDLHTLRIYRVHGPVHCPPVPKGTNELVFQLQRGVRFNWLSSGFFVDWHCHNVDVACWAKGAWPVSAQGFGGRTHPEAGNLLDHYSIEFTYADGAKLFAFSRHMPGCWQTYADYAHGTKGSARIMKNLSDPDPCIYKGSRMEDADIVWSYGQKDLNPYHAEWQLLLDAIRQNKPHNEARRAAEADLAALMGQMATHSGQMVTWDEAMNSTFQYVKDIDNLTFDSPPPILAGPDGMYAAPIPGKTREF